MPTSAGYSRLRIGREAQCLRMRLQDFSNAVLRRTERGIFQELARMDDIDQKALELQRVNNDYIRLAVELLKKRKKRKYRSYEGALILHYRANKVVELLNIFDVQ